MFIDWMLLSTDRAAQSIDREINILTGFRHDHTNHDEHATNTAAINLATENAKLFEPEPDNGGA